MSDNSNKYILSVKLLMLSNQLSFQLCKCRRYLSKAYCGINNRDTGCIIILPSVSLENTD